MPTESRLQVVGTWAADNAIGVDASEVETVVENSRKSWPEPPPLQLEFYNFAPSRQTNDLDDLDDGYLRPNRYSADVIVSSSDVSFSVIMLASSDDIPSHCHELALACAQASLDVFIMCNTPISTETRLTFKSLDGSNAAYPVAFLNFENVPMLHECLRRLLTQRIILADRALRRPSSSPASETVSVGSENEVYL